MADLNRNQQNALGALLTTPSVAAAARVCGLSERTIWRYLGDPEFERALRQRQDSETRALTAALVGLSGRAVKALRDLLTDPETPPSVRARAALGWLRERRQAVELDALTLRVARLEELLRD